MDSEHRRERNIQTHTRTDAHTHTHLLLGLGEDIWCWLPQSRLHCLESSVVDIHSVGGGGREVLVVYLLCRRLCLGWSHQQDLLRELPGLLPEQNVLLTVLLLQELLQCVCERCVCVCVCVCVSGECVCV